MPEGKIKFSKKYPYLFEERFKRSSGPGGQNVNKVSTAVELRFNLLACTALSAAVKDRIKKLAGHSLTQEGVVILQSDRFRTQEHNRKDVHERLQKMIDRALEEPKVRIVTSPPRSSRVQRRQAKARRALLKTLRRSKPDY